MPEGTAFSRERTRGEQEVTGRRVLSCQREKRARRRERTGSVRTAAELFLPGRKTQLPGKGTVRQAGSVAGARVQKASVPQELTQTSQNSRMNAQQSQDARASGKNGKELPKRSGNAGGCVCETVHKRVAGDGQRVGRGRGERVGAWQGGEE